jgi:hypothetical protein
MHQYSLFCNKGRFELPPPLQTFVSISQLLGRKERVLLFIDSPKPPMFITIFPEPKNARDIEGFVNVCCMEKCDSKFQIHICLPPRLCTFSTPFLTQDSWRETEEAWGAAGRPWPPDFAAFLQRESSLWTPAKGQG